MMRPAELIERDEVEAALRDAHSRFVALIRSVPVEAAGNPSAATPGWTVADTAAHVLTVLRRGLGDRRRSDSAENTGELNQICLDETPERDLAVLADLLAVDGAASLDLMASLPDDLEFRFHAGLRTTIVPVSCVVLGEFLVHGCDIATGAGVAWKIPDDQATMVMRGSRSLIEDGWLDAADQAPDVGEGGAQTLLEVFRRVPPSSPEMAHYLERLRPL